MRLESPGLPRVADWSQAGIGYTEEAQESYDSWITSRFPVNLAKQHCHKIIANHGWRWYSRIDLTSYCGRRAIRLFELEMNTPMPFFVNIEPDKQGFLR